jgi:hypothetical protein
MLFECFSSGTLYLQANLPTNCDRFEQEFQEYDISGVNFGILLPFYAEE